MEFVFELILQCLGEFLLQGLFELLAEAGLRGLAAPFRRPPSPVGATIGFTLWGAAAGAVSLWIMPASAIHNPLLRQVNLVVTPVAIGGVMALVGKIRLSKGQDLVRLDRFVYAVVFAFAMALVRFIWAA